MWDDWVLEMDETEGFLPPNLDKCFSVQDKSENQGVFRGWRGYFGEGSKTDEKVMKHNNK